MTEVRTAIRCLEVADLGALSIDQIKDFLTPLYRGLQVAAPRFDAGLAVHRSRRPNIKAANVSDVTYPPPEVTPLGRANREHSPVFYGATARNILFFEANPHADDTLTLTRWRTTAPLLVTLCGFTADAFRKLDSSRGVPDYGLQADLPDNEVNRFIHAYFADLFTEIVDEPASDSYKLTAAIAEKHLSSDMFGGMMYPTVPMRANGENVALTPAFVDQHLAFERAEYVLVKREYDFKYDIEVLDTADHVSVDGAIAWKGHGDEWTLRGAGDELTLTAEDDVWVARDRANNLVPPDP